MMLVRIVILSVLVGAMVAGLVWFGWGLLENVLHLLRQRRSSEPPNVDAGAGDDPA